jgi:DNA-directed RNA polymerase specialized sigma24 family protein
VADDDFPKFLLRMDFIIENHGERIGKYGGRLLEGYAVLLAVGSRFVLIPLELQVHEQPHAKLTDQCVRSALDRVCRRRRPVPGGTDALLRFSALPAPPAAEERSEAADPVETGLFARALDGIRGEFEPRTWLAFWKTAVDGRAPRDGAAELGMTSGAVRVAKSRVLQRLRAELGDLPT